MRRRNYLLSALIVLAGMGTLLFAEPRPAYADKKVWEDGDANLSLSGDARFRYEQDSDSRAGKADRDRSRERVRLRTGADFTANENLSMGFRLISASDNNQSPHQTLGLYGDGGKDSEFGLDRVFIKVKGGDFSAWAGRNALPAWNPGEFIWDDDLQPGGVGAGYNTSFGDVKLGLNLGHFIISEGKWDSDDTLTTYQLSIQTGDSFQIKAAIGALSFSDGNATDSTKTSGLLNGGTATITHALLELKAKDIPLKPTIGFAYATSNVDDKYGIVTTTATDGTSTSSGKKLDSADKTGMMAYAKGEVEGVMLEVQYWNNGYAAQPLLGQIGQDNTPFSSNFKGYAAIVGYKFLKNLSTDLRYIHLETKNKDIKTFDDGNLAMQGDTKRNRIQLNLNVGF